jgi:hypothetical protein
MMKALNMEELVGILLKLIYFQQKSCVGTGLASANFADSVILGGIVDSAQI